MIISGKIENLHFFINRELIFFYQCGSLLMNLFVLSENARQTFPRTRICIIEIMASGSSFTWGTWRHRRNFAASFLWEFHAYIRIIRTLSRASVTRRAEACIPMQIALSAARSLLSFSYSLLSGIVLRLSAFVQRWISRGPVASHRDSAPRCDNGKFCSSKHNILTTFFLFLSLLPPPLSLSGCVMCFV